MRNSTERKRCRVRKQNGDAEESSCQSEGGRKIKKKKKIEKTKEREEKMDEK